MTTRRNAMRAAAALGLGGGPVRRAAAAGTWPDRPLRWVVGYPAGGPTDHFARLIGGAMAAALGQPVLVDPRPGAGGIIATEAVLRAPADGHTLLSADNGMLVFSPALYARLPYDPDRDLAPIGLIGRFALLLAVRRESPFGSFAELRAAAHTRQVAFGSAGVGSPHHLVLELLKQRSGIEIIDVPFRGMPGVLPELLAGRVDAAISDITSALPALRAGDLRALMVLEESRSALLPEVPTAREAGQDVVARAWQGLCVAQATPAAIRTRLGGLLRDALATEPVAAGLRGLGAETIGGDAAEFAALLRQDSATWRPLIRSLGIHVNP